MTSLNVFEKVLASTEMNHGLEEEILNEEDAVEDAEDTEEEYSEDEDEE